ncbi:MAG: hypothetical protein M1823_002883 [Watsoniomyces obsoletus]|nr:MAG: hypothetical protein M1823_002883 [Watsoniomyces obsoletus]
MAHYLGIDVGTGSARACLMDETGDIKALSTHDIGLWKPQQGYYEQSTTDIWRAICACVRGALRQGSIEASSVRGIGFDATCSLTVLSSDDDRPISVTGPDFDTDRNIILWLDHRPLEEAKTINATKHNLLRYVGGTMSVEMEMPKVLWLKKHMPPELFARCKFYDLADALTHLATDRETRSFCSAVCKQGYVPVGVDGSVKGWQEDFLRKIGLEELARNDFQQMGGVNGVNGHYLSAGELVGRLSEKAANELGLSAGIAVGSGVIDAYAGWIGTVGAKVDLGSSLPSEEGLPQAFTRLAAVAGTSTCHLAMSPTPLFVNGVWGPYRDVLVHDHWMAEGGQSATGELLKHVVETHPAYQEALSASGGVAIYYFLNKHLEEMTAKSGAPQISWLARHVFFYGDLFGNRSPIADPSMTGAVIGLNSDISVDALAIHYYGAMEFIALQTRQIIETMNQAGHRIQSIFMSGSLCQNKILVNLIAAACRMPVVIPRYIHAAVAHGAAMLGAKAATADDQGRTEDLWSIMSRMSKPGTVIHPRRDAGEEKLLDVKYEVFLEQCHSQRSYRARVDDAIMGWKEQNAPFLRTEAMTRLSELPRELLDLILAQLSKKDHLALVRTSQQLRLLAEPFIYRRISCRWVAETDRSPIHLLLRSCLERPQLPSLIEEVEFVGKLPKCIWTKTDPPKWTKKEVQLVLDVVDAAGLDPALSLSGAVNKGAPEAYISLLLFILPCLKRLRFRLTLRDASRYIGPMLRRLVLSTTTPGSFPPGLEHVQHVECCLQRAPQGPIFWDETLLDPTQSPPVKFDDLVAFFHLPSIRHLTLLVNQSDPLPWPVGPKCTSTLSTLVLHQSGMSETDLERILSLTPNLRELHYDIWRRAEPAVGQSGFVHANELRQALEHVKSSLQRLVIPVSFFATGVFDIGNGSTCGLHHRLESLQEFRELESLEIATALLLGYSPHSAARLIDVLPINLRRLCLRDDLSVFELCEWDETSMLSQIGEHLADCQHRTPRLELIQLHLDFTTWGPEGQQALYDMCSRAKVAYELRTNSTELGT